MTRSRAVTALFVAFSVLYPPIVFFWLKHFSASAMALLLLAMLAVRAGLIPHDERKFLLPLLMLLAIWAGAASYLGSDQMLLWYPALINFVLAAVFAATLWRGEPLLLRFAKRRQMPMGEHAPRYLRKLTGVWTVFFLFNGGMAVWSSAQPIQVWTLYNGFIAYLLIALLLGTEWIYRGYYKKRMESGSA